MTARRTRRDGRDRGSPGLRLAREPQELLTITRVIVRPGRVNSALEPLRMGLKLDRYRDTARMVLEPWLVEAALARLGDHRLTLEKQQIVADATRTPSKVRWPDWWEVGR